MALHAVPISRPATLQVRLECDLSKVRQASAHMKTFLADQGFAPADLDACELAVVEACNNAIKYAGQVGRCKEVGLEVICGKTELEVRVTDHTEGFELPKKIQLPDFEKESGRGLYLIESLMDELTYLRGRGENCLVMRKHRKPISEANAAAVSADEANRRLGESEQVIRDMAEELSSCYESLSAIFRCSSELGKTNDLEEFARRLLMDLAQITCADWFVLRLVPREGGELRLFTASREGIVADKIPLDRATMNSVEMQAARAREDVWFDSHRQLREGDPLYEMNPAAHGLVHPIFLGDNLIGTIAVAKDGAGPTFTAVQANVVHTFSDFLAIQIMNARFNEEQVRIRLVSRELEIAQQIQRSLLPKSIPRLPGMDLAGFCQSAHQVGGDFYDVLKVRDDAVLLVIADVMGKGIPAAMFAAILRSLLRAAPEWMDQPSTLLERANRLMYEELSAVDMFITAQLVFVDAKNRVITAASAGHCPGLLTVDDRGSIVSIAPDGLPLGIEPNTSFSSHTETLRQPAKLLLYTDGLTEARNPHGEFFGQDRLMKWLRKEGGRRGTAQHFADDLADYLTKFQSSAAQTDDQTFLILAE
jgi:serine phosphatase RsbU (regulator of sigma subunit)/anti-sigma regulatory factor (Ser/Thr protein kinase)